jgi:hypothetical protein
MGVAFEKFMERFIVEERGEIEMQARQWNDQASKKVF